MNGSFSASHGIHEAFDPTRYGPYRTGIDRDSPMEKGLSIPTTEFDTSKTRSEISKFYSLYDWTRIYCQES